MAIQGDGFFALGDANGSNRVYTRAGDFITSLNNELTSKSGQYVLGWNIDNMTGNINTSTVLEPVKIDLGSISQPKESTDMAIKGNLNADANIGDVIGFQAPSWDRLGTRHDINFDFIKTSGNTYKYVATPVDQFKASGSITDAVFLPSSGVVTNPQFMKGDYQINTVASATPGSVDITVTDPSGNPVLTQTITDVNQTVKLNDGTNNWFTIDYASGNVPSSATFSVGETGDMTFNSIGQMTSITGSSPSGTPLITYTPASTGNAVNIDVDMGEITGLSADSAVEMTNTNGSGASTLINFTITDGGIVDGYYSDGTVKQIAQVAMASFSNSSGLSRTGQGNFLPTPNSGVANIGIPNTGSRGQIKAQATESSNVDLAKQFTDMLTVQKSFQANTKVISTTDQVLNDVIQLIR
jgi:flagellar hook protein FlgE